MMIGEISAATGFLCNILKKTSRTEFIENIENFDNCLQRLLVERYQDHWFPERPFKGSGYRCIRINHTMEPMLTKAAKESGLDSFFLNTLPNEFTIWVDPKEVSYRIGENGSIGVIFSSDDEANGNDNNQQASLSKSSTAKSQANLPNHAQSCKQQFQASSSDNINFRQFAAFVSS